jgi:hypothetical protein
MPSWPPCPSPGMPPWRVELAHQPRRRACLNGTVSYSFSARTSIRAGSAIARPEGWTRYVCGWTSTASP